MQKTNQEEFRIVKVFKRKVNKLLNGKAMITHLIDGLIKKTLHKMTLLNYMNLFEETLMSK